MSANLIITFLEIGLIFGLLAMGIYITFIILDIPDLTVDGSFTFGASISAMLCLHNLPILGLILGFLAGAMAGVATSVMNTKLKINVILAGILTMTGLYSINFWVTKKTPSFSLNGGKTIFSVFDKYESIKFLNSSLNKILTLLLILLIVIFIIFLLNRFFKTRMGVAIRATGDNEMMINSSSISTDLMKIIAFAIANGLVGLSGALFIQRDNSYTSSVGVGMMVIGLASIIIGEAIFRRRKIGVAMIIVTLGAVMYRFLYTCALLIPRIDPIDIKIITVVLIVIILGIQLLIQKIKKRRAKC